PPAASPTPAVAVRGILRLASYRVVSIPQIVLTPVSTHQRRILERDEVSLPKVLFGIVGCDDIADRAKMEVVVRVQFVIPENGPAGYLVEQATNVMEEVFNLASVEIAEREEPGANQVRPRVELGFRELLEIRSHLGPYQHRIDVKQRRMQP